MLASLSRRAILAIYAVIIIVPLTVVAFGSFKSTQELFAGPFSLPHSLSPDNFAEVVGGQNLGSSFMNSAIVTGISVPLTLFLASLAGYAVSRLKGFMSWAIFGFLVLGMAIPAQANMVPLYVLFGRLGLLDSLAGLVVANVVSTLPIAVFILGGFMRTLPKELYEASSIDGSGPWKTYSSIALPLSAPSIAAAAVPAAVHPVPRQPHPAAGAAEFPGRVPDQLPAAVRRRDPGIPARRHRLRFPAAVLRCRYHRRSKQGMRHQP